jgi:hypothetical protein
MAARKKATAKTETPKRKQGQRGKDRAKRKGSPHHPAVLTEITRKILTERQERAAYAREVRAQRMLQDANSLDDLTDLQRNFVIEYSFDRNKTAAYRRAKGKIPQEFTQSDCVSGVVLFNNAKVKKLLTQIDDHAREQSRTSREELLDILVGHARSNFEDFAHIDENGEATLDLSKASRPQLRSITEITQRRTVRRVRGSDDEEEEVTDTRLKRVDPLKAVELLGKTAEYRMFSDQIDFNNPANQPPQLQIILVQPGQAPMPQAPMPQAQMAPALPPGVDPPAPEEEKEHADKE